MNRLLAILLLLWAVPAADRLSAAEADCIERGYQSHSVVFTAESSAFAEPGDTLRVLADSDCIGKAAVPDSGSFSIAAWGPDPAGTSGASEGDTLRLEGPQGRVVGTYKTYAESDTTDVLTWRYAPYTLVLTAGYEDPLPVELTSFTAAVDGTDVVLQWHAANWARGFVVQEKRGDWHAVAEAGEGTGAYRTVLSASPGEHRYRLEMTDKYGVVTYSEAVTVTVPAQEFAAQVRYTGGGASLHVQGAQGEVQVRVYDVLGRRVRRFEMKGRRALDPGPLPAGLYVIRAEAKGRQDHTKWAIFK